MKPAIAQIHNEFYQVSTGTQWVSYPENYFSGGAHVDGIVNGVRQRHGSDSVEHRVCKHNIDLEHPNIRSYDKLRDPSRGTENTDHDLTSDWIIHHPEESEKNKLVVLLTGMKGPDGYFGDLFIQTFLNECFGYFNDNKTGLLIGRALNPFGYANDLVVGPMRTYPYLTLFRDNYKGNEQEYEQRVELFNGTRFFHSPQRTVRWFEGLRFMTNLFRANNISKMFDKNSIVDFIISLERGQYEDQSMVFYGGKEGISETKRILTETLRAETIGYKEVYVVDVTAGSRLEEDCAFFEDFKRELKIPRNPKVNCKIFSEYDLVDLFANEIIRDINPLATIGRGKIDFGTIAGKTRGSRGKWAQVFRRLNVLYARAIENQAWNNSPEDRKLNESARFAIKNLFWPAYRTDPTRKTLYKKCRIQAKQLTESVLGIEMPEDV